MIAYFVKGPQHGLVMELPDPPMPVVRFPVMETARWVKEDEISFLAPRNALYYMTENRDVYIFGDFSR